MACKCMLRGYVSRECVLRVHIESVCILRVCVCVPVGPSGSPKDGFGHGGGHDGTTILIHLIS